MPTEQRTSEWNKKVSGHIKYDFARITAAAINSNSHFVIISFPGFQKSKTFCIADLDWIQAADSGYQGDDYDSKDSEWFVFGETRKVLNGETTAVTTTTWDDSI
jgi:hypothetical protein